jgi:hypothetical protein
MNIAAARVKEFYFASLTNIKEDGFFEAHLSFLLSIFFEDRPQHFHSRNHILYANAALCSAATPIESQDISSCSQE